MTLPAPAAAPPVPASRPAQPDLMAYVEAQRRARADPTQPQESAPAAPRDSERERANRTAAANLATGRQVVFGYDPNRSGGVFQVERLTSDYAEFTFAGWNSDVRRRTKQTIEVRKGSHPDIRVAVVRSMIDVIRRYEPVEFTWDSHRLGRTLTLSSRVQDSAGLEEFMMAEFFTTPPPSRR
jgi:hypothetical protein